MARASHDDKKKLKKPPTFQHLPEHRAKKLKKEWVEKQKIQSKWKAQKKREGIVTLRDARKSATIVEKKERQEDDKGADVVEKEKDVTDELRASSDRESIPAEDSEPEPTPDPTQSMSRRRKAKEAAREEEELSLRELQRRAYSRDSLHHNKSGRGGKAERGTSGNSRGASRGSSAARGRGSGRGNDRGQRGRGRGSGERGGQPDMRLRMSALLQKIKHDVGQ
ncbi:hypothetical protein PENSPDRAFT_751397 [Peniophora sp. CONT]|nr:hypothetical protein PENSPDRAFT_751397 [Peniophora sp. CONT]